MSLISSVTKWSATDNDLNLIKVFSIYDPDENHEDASVPGNWAEGEKTVERTEDEMGLEV